MSVNFISLHDKIRTKDDAIKYLQENNIIKKEKLCIKCNVICPISSSDTDNYVFFKCKTCRSKESIRKDTFLYNKNIALKTFLLVLYLFTATPQLRIPQIIHEANLKEEADGSVVVGEGNGISPTTIVEYHALFRDVICGHLLANYQDKKIGGPGCTVEVDESMFGKRKYNKGKFRGHRRAWILGGICRETGEIFIVECSKCDKATLQRLILQHVAPGTHILTDGWAAYRDLDQIGYTHAWVNHDKHYVDPETGVHTNTIESWWFAIKRTLPRGGKYNLSSYLPVFLWRHATKQAGKDPFQEVLLLLSIEQRSLDAKYDTDRLRPKERVPIDHMCFYCAEDFTNEHLLLEHLQKCVERPPWEHQCFECGKEFETAHSLLIHGHTCSERLLMFSK